MNFDFALILVLATAITGVIWLCDTVFFARARAARAKAGSAADAEGNSPGQGSAGQNSEVGVKDPVLVEYSRSFFPVLLIVLLIRSFLIEPFQIPSQSMVPTLDVGDFILVNKYRYGLRLPVIGTKIIGIGEPARGDVMVFRNPEDDFTNYIKRVVGLPGDHLRYDQQTLFVNGQAVDQKLVAALPAGRPALFYFEEKLGEGVHRILRDKAAQGQGVGEWIVPEGHYFMMGDNRDHSRDSRFIGFVPDRNIVGQAFAIWMHWESFFSLPSFSRVGWIR